MHGKCPKGADLASRVPPSTPPDGKTSGCHQQIFLSPIPLSASQCHIYFPVFAIRALCTEQTFRPVYAWGKIYPAVFHTEWLFIYILAFSTSAELEMAMSSGPALQKPVFSTVRKYSNCCGWEPNWEYLRAPGFTTLSYSRGRQESLRNWHKTLFQNNHDEWATPIPKQTPIGVHVGSAATQAAILAKPLTCCDS